MRICAIEGLEPPAKARQLQSYISEDGCVEGAAQYNQRIITISGDANNLEAVKNAARILSKKGVLTIYGEFCTRKITVNDATVTIGKRYPDYCTFVIQMTCDYPHFTDIRETETAVFKILKYLTKDAVFPLVLSERTSSGVVYNKGDIKIYPLIAVEKTTDEYGENTITITNKTTGKRLVFNKSMEMGERVEIDVKNRKVTSNIDGNIIHALDRFSSLSDMWLDMGENDISVDIGGEERGLSVTIISSNEYTEAI